MTNFSRRDLLKTGALTAASLSITNLSPSSGLAASASEETDPWLGLKIGVATYTMRELPIEEAIKVVKRVGLKYVSIKNVKNHIDISHTPEERQQRLQMFKDAGLVPLSIGNVGMKNDEADIRRAFEFARDLGVKTMVCAPDKNSVPILDKMVKEFDIKLAIHAHGPEDKEFPSPYDVWQAVQKYDKRIGLCIDVGHTARANVDPAEAILKLRERVYDVHLKDISALGNRNTPVECGRGVLNLRAIFSSLLKIKFQGHAGFEYEKDGKDPLPGLAESVGYAKGLLVGLK
ncbi:MAG: sugar phosphate isomerase/epimerase [Blastocatellia bacterium]|nr:sugar phosphate isomerase/epimerase [Blastocatellia bacterium]